MAEYMRLTSSASSPENTKTTTDSDPKWQEEPMFLIRGKDKLAVTGCQRSSVKLVVFIFLCVITFPVLPITYFLLGFWAPRWKVLLLHSRCCMRDATLVLVQEAASFTATTLFRVELEDTAKDNYLVQKLQQFAVYRKSQLLMFDYKLDRFVVTESGIEPVRALGAGELFSTLKGLADSTLGESGTSCAVKTLIQVYGKNMLDVPLPPLIYFILTEVLTFFYIFQLFSCIVWYVNQYEVYATAIIGMSIISASSTTYLARSTVVKLRKAVRHEVDVIARRDGADVSLRSGDLVPGDVVKLALTETLLSFDGILLSGNVVVDEAMLTGESVPILKNPLPLDRLNDDYWAEKNEVNTLFSGTKILQTRPPNSGDVHVIVTRTGFTTKKGETVKFMLHPKKGEKFKFYSEAYTYIKIMGVIGLIGFIYNIVDSIKSDYSFGYSVLNSLDLITIIIAPSLPLALSISVYYAIRRLAGKKIKCAIPNAINVAGKIKLVVFDKTGTLTEEGLTLHCVLSADSATFGEETDSISGQMRPALASCHSLSVIEGRICGDPIDLIGQQCSGFQFEDKQFDKALFTNPISAVSKDSQSPVQYGLVKIVPFESHLKRMSVVCEDSDQGKLHVFCKGAPEQILQHCSPHTVPKDFSAQLDKYSSLGYRIIALASKSFTQGQDGSCLETTSREDLESELCFLGLLVLANRLKPQTQAVVEELQRAEQRVVMCTGDNLLTAVCVGRDCSLLPPAADLYIVTAEQQNSESGAPSEELVVNFSKQAATQTVCKDTPSSGDAQIWACCEDRYTGPLRKVHLAMDGRTFRLIAKLKPKLMDRVVVTGTIFARFSPDEKLLLIEELQKRDYSVCMCGDGANDCEALQHANVGIALSKCEASLAAPFTSSNFNVTCVPILLKEGQGALENSMAVFRFTAMYSIIQYVSVILLVRYDSILGDYQYLLEDLGVVLLFDFALGYTRPSPVLSPKRPRGSLLHPFILYSFILQTALSVSFILLAMYLVQQQEWYDPFDVKRAEALAAGEIYVRYFETTVNFFASSFQYVIMALVFSIGHPHRRAVYTNLPMLAATLCSLGLLLLCLFLDPTKIPKMDIVDIPDFKFKLLLLALVACNGALSLLVEYSFRVVKPIQSFLRLCRCKKGYKNKFKYVIEELNEGATWPEGL